MVARKWYLLIGAAVLLLSPASAPAKEEPKKDESRTNKACYDCHDDEAVEAETPRGEKLNLYINKAVMKASVHEDNQCVDCHKGEKTYEEAPHNGGEPMEIGCAGSECHDDMIEEFGTSAHGKALADKVQGAPTCRSCHQIHYAKEPTAAESIDNKIHQEKLCLSCHLDNPDVKAQVSPKAGFIAQYEKSVHGAAVLKGDKKAANCVNCHGSHTMLKGLDPDAKTNKQHVADTCGKCHEKIATEYKQTSHGLEVARGNGDSPTCTNCHGEHGIYKHDDPRSPVAKKNLSQQVCSPCHNSLALTSKYELASDRFKTFADSYHGLAIAGGGVGVANCASCHSSHNIKPSSDPTSTIHKANLAKTCGECHPAANERFAMGAVHVTTQEHWSLYWIGVIYMFLIAGTIGGMFFHNLLDFFKKARLKLALRRGEIAAPHHAPAKPRLFMRMTLNERLQHGALLVSFITLVLTGFMLRYPNSFWVQGIRSLSIYVFEGRSLVHRIAGVVMIAASAYHLYYIIFTAAGRKLVRDLFPRLQDAKDAVGLVAYNLGLRAEKPRFGRFGYIEKAEYWALIWGNIVMGATGFIMWFDNYFMGLFGKLGYDIARAVHYYEAWLAALAIAVWHFYFVIFNPDVYPINLAFWKGTISEEEMADEHPLELERIKKEEGQS
jgi:predicted CXXCH cytochrome family protein